MDRDEEQLKTHFTNVKEKVETEDNKKFFGFRVRLDIHHDDRLKEKEADLTLTDDALTLTLKNTHGVDQRMPLKDCHNLFSVELLSTMVVDASTRWPPKYADAKKCVPYDKLPAKSS